MKSKILRSKRSKSKKAVRSKSKKATRSKSKNTKRNIVKKAIKKGGAPHESLLGLMNIITCPISREIMIDPVITADGMTYEKEEIQEWLNLRNTSPLTGAKLENKKLIPNNSLKQVINDIVDQGFLNYKTITEYLTKKGLNKLDIMTMRSKIYEQKMKNRGKDIFTSPENKDYKYFKILGINVNYRFTDELKEQKILKIKLNNNKILELKFDDQNKLIERKLVDEKPDSFLQLHFLTTKDIIFDNLLAGNNNARQGNNNARQGNNNARQGNSNIINLSKKIKTDLLVKENQIVNKDYLPYFLISPRLYFSPALFAFLGFVDSFVTEKILELSEKKNRLKRVNNLPEGAPHQIFILDGDFKNMYKNNNSYNVNRISTYNSQFKNRVGSKFNLCTIRVQHKESTNTSPNFKIAFTGKSGIGKSFVAHETFLEEDIFETDSTNMNNFIKDYKRKGRPTLIVVGQKDKNLNLKSIREKINEDILECKFNILSEEQEKIRREEYSRILAGKEEVLEKKLVAFESKIGNYSGDDIVVVGYIQRKEDKGVSNNGHEQGEETLEIILSDGDSINISKSWGSCFSGYCGASWANVSLESSYQPFAVLIEENSNGRNSNVVKKINLSSNKVIIFKEIIRNSPQNIKIVFEQKDKTTGETEQFEITLDEDGDDDYYPSGDFDADKFYEYAYPLEEENYPSSNSN